MKKRDPETRTCLNCGVDYVVNKHYDRNVKFCSKLCSAKYNFSGERQRKWSGGPITFVCKVCGKEKTNRRGGSSGNQPLYCSRVCSNIGKNTQVHFSCRGCGKDILVHPSWIEQGRQYCSQSCYRRNWIGPSNIEQVMQNKLSEIGIEFIPEYPVGRYHVDIFIPSSNLAIECDGVFWHSGRQSRDDARDNFIRGKGFTVLRFTGKEIHNSPDACVSKIVEAISNH